ncbi:hypothetical protein EWI07_08675 [Sporolactobacillus sp. THM7-4]|nr:hypothetical protein EWI07_08675 [Sporolactobacillus sp. THM7-4]
MAKISDPTLPPDHPIHRAVDGFKTEECAHCRRFHVRAGSCKACRIGGVSVRPCPASTCARLPPAAAGLERRQHLSDGDLLPALEPGLGANGMDGGSHFGKRMRQVQRGATDVTRELMASTLREGIRASYVLFDSWFSSPKMFHQLNERGLHTVAMVKRSKKVYYRFNGRMMDVRTIFKTEKKRRGRSRYLFSVCVEAPLPKGKRASP